MPNLPVTSATDDDHLGCPVLTKTRVLPVNKGVCSTIQWEIRDRTGAPVDISSYVECEEGEDSSEGEVCGQVIFRFGDILGETSTIYQIVGEVVDAESGLVQVTLSEALTALPGIFQMEVGVTTQSDDDPESYILVLTDKGMLSVERGLFGDISSPGGYIGPPTINEIRLTLRDTVVENQLIDSLEFDDAELIFALTRPLRYWNETPPPVATFNATNFPFHEMWLRATVAQLLKTAAYWYERNRLAASHGGISVDDMNKGNPYVQLSTLLQREWEDFVITRKVQINAGLAFGTVGSTYDS